MRNSINTSLNDLFRSAQSETDQEVMSQNEVERLLLDSNVRSVPIITKIGQQLYGRLFSTPLKIGMTAMTTVACIALGIIVLHHQPQPEEIHTSPVMSHPFVSSRTSEALSDNFPEHPNSTTRRVYTNGNNPPVLMPIISVSSVTSTSDSVLAIELVPNPIVQSPTISPKYEDTKLFVPLRDTNVNQKDTIGYKPSWYAGYVMAGVNQIINPFIATLPSLNFINGIRIGDHETIGLRIGFEFVNPVIVAKYVHVELGIDSRTFFGDGAIRPFVWGQASVISVPGWGILTPSGTYSPMGIGVYGIILGAGPGVQFRSATGFSYMLDAGYQTYEYGIYTIHFGIGF
jgi:hypothetical protein